MTSIIQQCVDAARLVYPENHVMQSLVVCQAILESALLRSSGGSALALKHHNFFGIKRLKSRPNDFVDMMTWEEVDGKVIRLYQPFAVFKDVEDCFKQHKIMMYWIRYKNVLDSKTVDEAFSRIQKSGWATDSKYPSKLSAIYSSHVKPLLK